MLLKLNKSFWILIVTLFIVAPVAAKYKGRFDILAADETGVSSAYTKILDRRTNRVRYAKDRILVKFKKGSTAEHRKAYMLKNKMEPIAKLGNNVYSCQLIDGIKDSNSLSLLTHHRGLPLPDRDLPGDLVEDFDLDEYKAMSLNAISAAKRAKRRKRKSSKRIQRTKRAKTNLITKQWHIRNDGVNGLKKGADVGAQEAWEYSKGLGIKVAVIDTGFDTDHPDINFIEGYDVVDHDSRANTPSRSNENHGTAVAGVIAAKDDDIGVVGVAPNVEIVPIRLIPDDGYVSVSDIIMAHRKAMELDVDIINNSWTSYDPSLPKGQQFELSDIEIELYRELYEEANEGKGILVIFASGNSGSSDFRNSPEARSPYTLAVGATDSSDKRSSFSTYGSELDLVAPGGGDNEGIYTTDRVDIQIRNGDIKKRVVLGYAKGNTNSDFKGTSAAAPVVAGAAALVWAVNPELTATEVRQILVRTAQRLPDYEFVYGKNAELGYGRVDARAAVSLAKQY